MENYQDQGETILEEGSVKELWFKILFGIFVVLGIIDMGMAIFLILRNFGVF